MAATSRANKMRSKGQGHAFMKKVTRTLLVKYAAVASVPAAVDCMSVGFLMVSESGIGMPAIVGYEPGGWKMHRRWRVRIRIDCAVEGLAVLTKPAVQSR